MDGVGQLFATAMRIPYESGIHACTLCGSACSDRNKSREVLKDTFSAIDTIACPGSQYVCGGCAIAMTGEAPGIVADGVARVGRAAQVRLWSWIITEAEAACGSKKSMMLFRSCCLHPPIPPYVIVLTDGGQRHLLYLAKVCRSSEIATVCFDGENIDYKPWDLQARMRLLEKLIAATGKPALAEGFSRRQRLDIGEQFGVETLHEWDAVNGSPLTRMAIWLSPGKEMCLANIAARV